MFKKRGLVFLVSVFALVFSVSLVSAQTDGIPLQKDVFLGAPIFGPEDLPEEITFTLFDAQDAIIPLGSQTFRRGQYTVDFEFSQSDGITGGNAARVKANFTQMLNLVDAFGEPIKPRELWAALQVADAEVGPRTKVSDETMVQLLLNSDASMSTYLTLAYEGDDNPITTIYKGLPLSSASGLSANEYITSLFSSVSPEDRSLGSLTSPYWEQSGTTIYYNDGNVGIGTGGPVSKLDVRGGLVSIMPTGGAVLVGEGLGPNEYGGYIWDASANKAAFATASDNVITFGHYNGTVERMRINNDGRIGINTSSPGYTLAVNGTVGCKELTVTSTGWADFVFQDDYKLPSLNEVETFISKNKHLPGIPTEVDVKKNGVSVGDMSAKLLQKVEELTLYMIELKKENEDLKTRLSVIQNHLGGIN